MAAGAAAFQFHKGTIKTFLRSYAYALPPDFNSIKVRLKLIQVSKLEEILLNFNSIKVRLKHLDICRSDLHCQEFQFHKGTIKTPT